MSKQIVCGLLLLSLLPISSSAGDDRDAIVRLVQESQRGGHERRDYDAYMSLWSDDVRLIAARAEKPAPTDSVIRRKQIEALSRLKYAGPKPKDVRLDFSDVKLTLSGDKATLRYRSTLKTPHSIGSADEIFLLRKTKDGWKAYENRYWPVELRFEDTVIRFTEEEWKKLDAEAERHEADKNHKDQAYALLRGWRASEALAAAKKATALRKEDADAWVLRGFAAVTAGDAADALLAFRAALKLDPKADVPDYIEKAK